MIHLTGFIERITDGVAWGRFDNGKTFDLPVDPQHQVGDTVLYSEFENVVEGDATHSVVIVNDDYATIYNCINTPEGLQIILEDHPEKEQ